MQLTKDKCGGAPGGNCKDPVSRIIWQKLPLLMGCFRFFVISQDFNIRTGAKFFADTLASNDGNAIETIGMYNGWKKGMTYVCVSLMTEV